MIRSLNAVAVYSVTAFCLYRNKKGEVFLDSYQTILKAADAQFIERRSRFIGYAKPVSTEADAIDFVNSIRKKHPDATHNVYAYVLREENKSRYSDDGEPQGTAGMPVLEVIRRSGLTDCAVVATRYFGGVLLGAGGLVRAYTHTAKIAVAAATPVKMSRCYECSCRCDYSAYSSVQAILSANSAFITNTEYTDEVRVFFNIESTLFERLKLDMTEKTAGRVDVSIGGEKFLPHEIEI